MRTILRLAIIALLLIAARPGVLEARPLTLSELFELGEYLDCVGGCGTIDAGSTYQQVADHYGCLATNCGLPPHLWEKNGIPPVDAIDHELAMLEYQDSQNPTKSLICYGDEDESVVVPGALCPGAVCLDMEDCSEEQCALPEAAEVTCEDKEGVGPVCWWPEGVRPAACPDPVCDYSPAHTPEDCFDGDGDGLPAWLEDHLGLDPEAADALCDGAAPCAFDEACAWAADYGTGLCEPRPCPDAGCTAFHLELVAQDDVQAIVHLYYDWTPIPARVLDLYLEYDGDSLVLEDTRALAPLAALGKELHTTHLSDGTLRLSVLDSGASHPIPTGPIVEMVFRRVGDGATTIQFVTEDALQVEAVAPFQGSGEVHDELADDALWGAAVALAPRDEIDTRLLLWYGFQSPDAPIEYENVPSADALCALLPACANEPDEAAKARLLARLERLQAGEVLGGEPIPGVTMDAAWFDGAADHLRLPVHFEQPLAAGAQSFSWSTWFYAEGPSADEKADTPQLLYTHVGFDERTRFGLKLGADGDGGAVVTLLDGDFLAKWGATEVPVAAGIPLRPWRHLGFTLEAASGEITLYLDGLPVTAEDDGPPLPTWVFQQPPMAIACPQFSAGKDVMLHEEGDVLGGHPPELIVYGVKRSGLHKIERMDPLGLASTQLLGDETTNYKDPDYSPVLDRIAFVSDLSGDTEIWVADGDGGDPRQVTVGFGDADRGITARRPRWAPDGSGLVFDSDVYDVPSYDNVFAQVRHLYYVGWDQAADQAAVELANGSVATQLDYEALVDADQVDQVRLTSGVLDRHHSRARFLEGVDTEAGTLGRILLQSAGTNHDDKRIEELAIDALLPLNVAAEEVPGLGLPGEEVRLLAAYRAEAAGIDGPVVTERLFFERAWVEYVPADQFSVEWSPWEDPQDGDDEPDGYEVTVLHQPAGYGEKCWDANFDGVAQAEEDRDGDGEWTEADCHPHDIANLYLAYDADALVLDEGGAALDAALADADKSLGLDEVTAFETPYVKIQVLSPLSAAPIPAGHVATIRFLDAPASEDPADTDLFGLEVRETSEALLLEDLTTPGIEGLPFDPAGRFDLLTDATFSPDGERLALSGISKAQPVLLVTGALAPDDPEVPKTAAEAQRIDQGAMRVRGMRWVREARYHPCGWVGGYQHPADKRILSSFRGGLDEMKIHAGLRHPMAFRSEAERGQAALEQAGLDGQLESKLPGCGINHLECPAYHLCVDSECAMVPCDPSDPWSCAAWGGRCTLRPEAVEQEYGATPDAFAWVCAAECNSDQQCLTKQCANGPCRFCDPATLTCIECRETIQQLGSLQLAVVEGCPDTKSFGCAAGTCWSDCYTFEDDASSYLCDPALEYCQKGQCVLHDWSWWDFAPATFSGGAGMRRLIPPDPGSGWFGWTQAVDQDIPITVTAYGVADYLQSPELLVEVRGGPFYGSDWHRMGRVQVHHRTMTAAYGKPYGLSSPYPFGELRLRMITSPYANLTGAATGLGVKDAQFCVDDLTQTALAAGQPVDVSPCYHQAQGSRYVTGYQVGIPFHEAAAACAAAPEGGCPVIQAGEHDFLRGGNPAAVVLDVTVDGAGAMNALTSDLVCTYEGDLVPVDGGAAKKVFYGDIATERSNQRDAYCALNPEVCEDGSALVEFDVDLYGYALLNCNVYDPAAQAAGISFSVAPQIHQWPAQSGAVISDNGDVCQVEITQDLVQPCHAWRGGDVTLDSHNAGTATGSYTEFQSLEFGLFRNFSHGEGYATVPLPAAPVRACVLGYDEGGGLVLSNKGDLLDLDAAAADPDPGDCAGTRWTFPGEVKLGKGYAVQVAAQPADPDTACVVSGGTGKIELDPLADPPAPLAAAATVLCGPAALGVGGTVTGATGLVTLRGTLSGADGAVKAVAQIFAVDGAFDFGAALPGVAGDGYEVVVTEAPANQVCAVDGGVGTLADADVDGVAVECSTPPSHALSVQVAGLAGSGLVLEEREGGGQLAVAADGTWALPVEIQEGAPFDLVVLEQPAGPAQVCAFAGPAAAAMPAGDHAVPLTCTTTPLYGVGGSVVGLLGEGLVLDLNGTESLAVAPSVAPGDQAFQFATQLMAGQPYLVAVLSQPAAPTQACEVQFGEGTVPAGGVDDVTVICGQAMGQDVEAWSVGGQVSGLEGSGLRLKLNNGQQNLDVDADGPFAFQNPLYPFTDYQVQVAIQPQDPVQTCVVTGGSGTVEHADVTDVAVQCYSAATLTTVFTGMDAFNGAGFDVRAFSVDDGALVARSAPGRKVKDGEAVITLAVPGNPNKVAGLLGGPYVVDVRLNVDGDLDPVTQEPIWTIADIGARKVLNMQDGQPATLAFTATHFAGLFPHVVVVDEVTGPLEAGAMLQCWWSPAGFGPVDLPPGPLAPVLAWGSGPCDQDTCSASGLVTMGKVHDIGCWVDNDGSGAVDWGDLVGAVEDVQNSIGLAALIEKLEMVD